MKYILIYTLKYALTILGRHKCNAADTHTHAASNALCCCTIQKINKRTRICMLKGRQLERRQCRRPLHTDNTISLSRHARPPIRTCTPRPLVSLTLLILLLLLHRVRPMIAHLCQQDCQGIVRASGRDQTEREDPLWDQSAVLETRDKGACRWWFNPLKRIGFCARVPTLISSGKFSMLDLFARKGCTCIYTTYL